jgi:hypothetical protein
MLDHSIAVKLEHPRQWSNSKDRPVQLHRASLFLGANREAFRQKLGLNNQPYALPARAWA